MNQDAANNRSGPRISAKVPVQIDGRDVQNQSVQEQTETLLVNEAGALIALASEFQLHDRARITNRQTSRTTDFRVAWRSASKLNQRWSYGIALLGNPDNFWNLPK